MIMKKWRNCQNHQYFHNDGMRINISLEMLSLFDVEISQKKLYHLIFSTYSSPYTINI